MDRITVKLPAGNQRKTTLKGWFSQKLYEEKLDNFLGYFIFTAFSILCAYLIAQGGLISGIVMWTAVIALPLFFLCIFNLQFGVYVILVLSFIILGILRFVDIPLGLAMDVLIFLMLFGLFVKQVKERNWGFASNPISYFILIWILYNVVCVTNPIATSKLAWAYTIRGMAGLMVLYFIALYAFKSVKSVSLYFKIWLAFAVVAALYGIFQEVYGLAKFELDWINADANRYKLFFNWGRFRKFSYFSNPTIFGIFMAYTGLLCFILISGPFSMVKKIVLGSCGILMFIAMIFTGTRTAYAMLPVGVMFYALLTFKRNILIFAGLFFLIGAVIILGPFQSLGPITTNNLTRIRSTFAMEDDPSFNARAEKHAFMQPYIRSHPMGGGLGSVGIWGQRFSPNAPLSQFGPDSGYVRIAVELGWIGLAIYLSLIFVIMKVGIRNFFLVKDPLIKIYLAGLLTVLYTLVVANYPQQAVTMYPTMVIFYISIALLVKLKDLETGKNISYSDNHKNLPVN